MKNSKGPEEIDMTTAIILVVIFFAIFGGLGLMGISTSDNWY